MGRCVIIIFIIFVTKLIAKPMEEKTQLNFSIATDLSLKIDKMLIDLKANGAVKKKTKNELLEELLALGYNAKMQKA